MPRTPPLKPSNLFEPYFTYVLKIPLHPHKRKLILKHHVSFLPAKNRPVLSALLKGNNKQYQIALCAIHAEIYVRQIQ